jgi:hypothetical protein
MIIPATAAAEMIPSTSETRSAVTRSLWLGSLKNNLATFLMNMNFIVPGGPDNWSKPGQSSRDFAEFFSGTAPVLFHI